MVFGPFFFSLPVIGVRAGEYFLEVTSSFDLFCLGSSHCHCEYVPTIPGPYALFLGLLNEYCVREI